MNYNTRDERQEIEGWTCLDVGDIEYQCPASDYERLLAEWKSGAAFLTSTTLYDEPHTMKAAKICAITLVTPESYASRLATDKAKKEKELTE